MVVNLTDPVRSESGQSLVEFAFMLPMLIGMSMLLIKLNTAIQASIVDQQYARAQTLQLTYNSPFFPAQDKKVQLIYYQMNQLLAGVQSNLTDEVGGGGNVPKATVVNIARTPNNRVAAQAPDQAGEEPTTRSKIRVRNTVTLCSQNYLIGFNSGSGPQPLISNGVNQLTEGTHIGSYCQSAMQFMGDDNTGN